MKTMGLDRLTRMLRQRIPGLLGVYLFGSRAKGSAGPASDIDIAVLSDPPLSPETCFELGGLASELAGEAVDLVDLMQASTVLRLQIIAHGQRLYCDDPVACATFEDRAFSDYALLNEERQGILDDIADRGRVYG